MNYFQILSCNQVVGTCCTDYGIVAVLDITRKIFDLIQLFIPILLLIMATVNFIVLITNPDAKNGKKKIINQFLAAVIIFFIPTIMNGVLNMMPDNFKIAACWQHAKHNAEITRTNAVTFKTTAEREKTSILINPDDYEMGDKRENSSSTMNGSAKGIEIVEYAKKFQGGAYLLKGKWDGEAPYKPTCCAGFISGVYRHFGIKIYKGSNGYWVPNIDANTSGYTVVTDGNYKAGDLVIYSRDQHVGMLTGKGKEMIHDSYSRGVVVDPSYKIGIGVKKIIRINGVN